MNNLTPTANQELIAAPSAELRAKILTYIQASTSGSTKRSYRCHVTRFQNWLTKMGYSFPSQPWQIAEYLINAMETRIENEDVPYKRSTIALWITAISLAHQTGGFDDPTKSLIVQKTIQGLINTHGQAVKKAKALAMPQILAMLKSSTNNPIKDQRDRCLLIIAVTGGFRTDELVNTKDRPGILINDVVRQENGDYIINIPKSKTDQAGKGRQVLIPNTHKQNLNPATELYNWILVVKEGQLFRSVGKHGNIGNGLSDAGVRHILKLMAKRANIFGWEKVSGHTARRSFINISNRLGFDNGAIAKQTGQTHATVNRYLDETALNINNPASQIWALD